MSSVVVVSRKQWDIIGGFDEQFRGWGFEDTAFAAAAETFGGIIRMDGEVIHFWHPTAARGQARHAVVVDQLGTRTGIPRGHRQPRRNPKAAGFG